MSKNALSAKERWYHGTANRDFDQFDPRYVDPQPRGGGSRIGVFFTNSRQQGDNFRRLALKYAGGQPDKSDGRVIEAAVEGNFKAVDMLELERERARELRTSDRNAKPSMLGPQRDWMLRQAAIARREGYDGIDFVNIMDDPLSYRERATHRVVFPHRVQDAIEIIASHILPPSGVVETTIAAARAEREARAAEREFARAARGPTPARSKRPKSIGRF